MSLAGRALLIFGLLLMAVPVVRPALADLRSSGADLPSLAGFWVPEHGGWVVEITPCSGEYCGRLVGLAKSPRPMAERVDAQNPDPDKRSTPLCGLEVLKAFKPAKAEPGKWEDGWIYDPDKGNVYSAEARLDGPDTLKLRGYIVLPLLGRSLTLTRETGPVNRCADGSGG